MSEQTRKLTIKSATEQYIETTRAIEGLKAVQTDAAAFLLEKARSTGRRTFGDDVAVVQTGGSLVLDQPAVKEHYAEIGEPLPQKRTKAGLALKLLK